MPVAAVVYFEDGTTSKGDKYVGFEIAAFCGNECRGTGTVTKKTYRGRSTVSCNLNVYGTVREVFRFYLYNPQTQTEYPLSGLLTYNTGNKKNDFYFNRIDPEDLKEGGHYAAAGSLKDNRNVKLRGEWDAAALTLLKGALGDDYVGQPDFGAATVNCDADEINLLRNSMANNSFIILSSTANKELRRQKNVVTATANAGDTLYTANLLELNDRDLFESNREIDADTVRIIRPTWIDGEYETCILPFVPQKAYRTENDTKSNEWDDFRFERFDGHATGSDRVDYVQIDNSDFTANTPYLMVYKGGDTATEKIGFVFEAYDGRVSSTTAVYGEKWNGVYTPYTVAATDDIYVLNSTGNALQKAKTGLTIPAFHCYFTIGHDAPDLINVRHSDLVAGLEQVTENSTVGNSTIYNLNGQRINRIDRKGLYIIDGKKCHITPVNL